MRSSHNLAALETTFTDDNLVPNAGLQVPAALAQKLGIAELVDARVQLPADAVERANCGIKALTVVGAMLAQGDSIDDCDVLRSGAATELFDATRAPSTIGTWLRGLTGRRCACWTRSAAPRSRARGPRGWDRIWTPT